MSKMSEDARHANKAKARKLANRETGDVDASGWTEAPAGFLHAEKKLGNRPISKQNLACGGRAALKHGGRKSRAMGGPPAGMGTAPSGAMASNAGQPLVASVSEPPQNRFSFSGNMSPLLGAAGMKRGGKAKRADGGKTDDHWMEKAFANSHGQLHKELHVPAGKKIPAKKLNEAEHAKSGLERKRANLVKIAERSHHDKGGVVHEKGAQNPEVSGTRPTGGRIAKADGGRAGKGKVNVNVIIAQRPEHQMMPGGQMPPHPASPPPMMPPPAAMNPNGAPAPVAPPPGGAPNMPPPSMGGRPPMPPMGRASGGKVYPIKDGAGGGKGRLEKVKAYGL